MLHYQISPPKKSVKTTITSDDESSRPAYLVLGAFATVPKIHFETIKLGQSKRKTLIVRNPTDQAAWLKFCKKPTSVFQLSSEAEPIIQAKDQYVLDITWTPSEVGQYFEAFQFQSSVSGIKFSVHLLGVCTAPATRSSAFRRRPLVSSQNTLKPTNQAKDNSSGITLPKTPLKRGSGQPGISKINMANVSTHSATPFSFIEPGTFIGNKVVPCETSSAENITPPNTPKTYGTSVSDMLDSFAFPFTPDTCTKKSSNATSDLRRESFFVEEEEKLFAQDESTSSPTRRDTYLIPPLNLGVSVMTDSSERLVGLDCEFSATYNSFVTQPNSLISSDSACSTPTPQIVDKRETEYTIDDTLTSDMDSGLCCTSESGSCKNETETNALSLERQPILNNTNFEFESDVRVRAAIKTPKNVLNYEDKELKNLTSELNAFLSSLDETFSKAKCVLSGWADPN